MSDTTSTSSVVPDRPQNAGGYYKFERGGVVWHWDGALWWPSKPLMRYFQLGRQQGLSGVMVDAKDFRDREIQILQAEHDAGGVRSDERAGFERVYALMLESSAHLEAVGRRKRNRWIGAGVVVALVVAAFAGCAALSGSNGSDDDVALMQVTAQDLCQGMVKKQLKSPSTAEFSEVQAVGSDPIVITGYVDSENGFGAMLRSSFQCTGTPQGQGVSTTLDSINPE